MKQHSSTVTALAAKHGLPVDTLTTALEAVTASSRCAVCRRHAARLVTREGSLASACGDDDHIDLALESGKIRITAALVRRYLNPAPVEPEPEPEPLMTVASRKHPLAARGIRRLEKIIAKVDEQKEKQRREEEVLFRVRTPKPPKPLFRGRRKRTRD